MAIKNAHTISQYNIMQWINENFYENSVTVEFTDKDTAIVTDNEGDSVKVYFDPCIGIVVKE